MRIWLCAVLVVAAASIAEAGVWYGQLTVEGQQPATFRVRGRSPFDPVNEYGGVTTGLRGRFICTSGVCPIRRGRFAADFVTGFDPPVAIAVGLFRKGPNVCNWVDEDLDLRHQTASGTFSCSDGASGTLTIPIP